MRANNIHFPKIAQSFWVYEAFKAQNKIATLSPVVLEQRNPDEEYLGTSHVAMAWHQFQCEFHVTKSARLLMKYGLKLFAKQLDDKPCFRFKSRGSTHFNTESGGGLCKRAVECPHFYRVDNRGILEAYRTTRLEDPAEAEKIVSDPQAGTNLFCQEANLFSPNGRAVVLDIIVAGLDLSITDPLSGAKFPTR